MIFWPLVNILTMDLSAGCLICTANDFACEVQRTYKTGTLPGAWDILCLRLSMFKACLSRALCRKASSLMYHNPGNAWTFPGRLLVHTGNLELGLCLEAVPRLLQIIGGAVVGLLQAALCLDKLLVDAGPQSLCLFPL